MPAYIRKYSLYQNSRPKKSRAVRTMSTDARRLPRATVYSFIYSTSYQTEQDAAANSKGQHCLFFHRRDVVLGGGAGACPLPAPTHTFSFLPRAPPGTEPDSGRYPNAEGRERGV